MVNSMDHTQKILLVEFKHRPYKNLLCPYELIKARLWERQDILSTEILVLHNVLECLYPESAQVFLPLTVSAWNLVELLVVNKARIVNNKEAISRRVAKKEVKANRRKAKA